MLNPAPPHPLPLLCRKRPDQPQGMPRLRDEPTIVTSEETPALLPPAPKKWFPRLPDRRNIHGGLGGFLDDHGRRASALAHILELAPAAAAGDPVPTVDQVMPDVTALVPEELVVQQRLLENLKLDLGAFYMPKEGKHPRGEDAHFLASTLDAFGVADGVGGWTKQGIDAGDFARQLVELCEAELEAASCRRDATTAGTGTGTVLDGVLERALARTTARGTSTACIAVVDGRFLRAVNIGDSGFLVVRGGKVAYHSPPQQHGFNRPYQVGGADRAFPPECADKICVEIEPGDVVVAGTDGLFDNLFDAEILDVLATLNGDGDATPEEMARAVGWAAVEAYVIGDRETPFSVACREAKLSWAGGKTDDVTVVVARVCRSMLLEPGYFMQHVVSALSRDAENNHWNGPATFKLLMISSMNRTQ